MFSFKVNSNLLVSLFIILISFNALGYSKQVEANNCKSKEPKFQKWCEERVQRENKLDTYFKENSEGLDIFTTGANRHSPGFIPVVMFSLFTELFPEIWGSDDSFLTPGLTKNTFSKNSKIPLGMGVSQPSDKYPDILGTIGKMSERSINMNLVGFNCAACHAGVVKGENGDIKTMIGAPNGRLDNLLFLMAKTSLSKNFTAEKFREALKRKGKNWNIYGDPKMAEKSRKEIQFFLSEDVAENWVVNIQTSGKRLFGAFKAFIEPKMYGTPLRENVPHPLAPKRGSLDAFFATFFAYITEVASNTPAEVEPAERASWIRNELGDDIPSDPAETDNPSIWNQRDRGANHWGGEFSALLPRNLSTAVAARKVPVHFANVEKITEFTLDLPSPAYPFDVDMEMAKRGKKHFTMHCASCHSGQNKFYAAEEVGTSVNRANHLNANVLSFLQVRLHDICPEDKSKHCRKKDGTPLKPEDVAQKTQGYLADRLDGIWARAPYGHNGSMPTLESIMIPSERPVTFYRGSLDYDTKKVGFQWKKDEPGVTVLYDTRLSGNSNQGHASEKYLGLAPNGQAINWKKNRKALNELLEYLKTL